MLVAIIMTTRFEDIDMKIEKLVFLLNAEEGNPGIYELTLELGRFDLTIEDKYKIARIVLVEILQEDLVVLEKYKDLTLNEKIETIDKGEIDKLLNNPFHWYPKSIVSGSFDLAVKINFSLAYAKKLFMSRTQSESVNLILSQLLGSAE